MFMVYFQSVKRILECNSYLVIFLFYFQGVRGALSRYVYCLNQGRVVGGQGSWWINPTKNCRFCALLRSKDVTQLEPETIPMELRTMCRIPGMREMLRKFQGRLLLWAGRTTMSIVWLLLQFVTIQIRLQ